MLETPLSMNPQIIWGGATQLHFIPPLPQAVIRQSVEQREQEKKRKRKEGRKGESSPPPKRGALDRFKK